jgi:Domain of unknown function (DUF1835)
MLHVTDGESVAGTLRESGIPGNVATHGDLLNEGPAPSGLNSEAWLDARARFLAESNYAALEEARHYLKACENTLAAFSDHEEVVLWLDHRLTDQLILIKVLEWFNRQNLRRTKLSLICVDRYPGIDHFFGLGQLTANQLTALIDTRLPVRQSQYRAARAAWEAFTSPDPTDIQRFLETDTSALPFVAAALRRHLEQFPSLDSGLSRTEQQALSLLRDRGSLSGAELYIAVQRLEEQCFMGDAPFYRVITGLSNVGHPLVQISKEVNGDLGSIDITPTGQQVLDGRADHINLNGIDRWLGGVHLQGKKAGWRWDRMSERIVGV